MMPCPDIITKQREAVAPDGAYVRRWQTESAGR